MSTHVLLVDKLTSKLVVNENKITTILTCGTKGPPGPQGIPGADGGAFTNPNPTPEDLGGIPAGSTFDDVPILDMWEDLLYPYQAPVFSSFLISANPGILEVGDTLTGGVKTFTWGTTNSDNIEADSLTIISSSSGLLASGLSNDGTEDVDIGSNIQHTSQSTESWTVEGTNTNEGTFNRSTSTYWRWGFYFGNSSNAGPLTETEIEALVSKELRTSRSKTYALPAGEYKYLCWPVAFGEYNTAKDADTGFPMAMEIVYTVSVTNSFGVASDYNVYRTTNKLAAATNIEIT